MIAVSAPKEVEVALVSVPEAEWEYNSRRLGLSARVNRVYLPFVIRYQLEHRLMETDGTDLQDVLDHYVQFQPFQTT